MTRVVAYLAALSILGAGFALTISPTSHNFGNVAVGGGSNAREFTLRGVVGDTLVPRISGPDLKHFTVSGVGCDLNTPGVCDVTVYFYPLSEGPKAASLDVTDRSNHTVSAALTGRGVAPTCTNTVVFCNYAFLYSGNFDWTTASETVKVTIDAGRATCNGSVTFKGRPKGIVSGTGLAAVEFVRGTIIDSLGNEGPERLVYRVTVACPSPEVPPGADGGAMKSRPAELGDFFQQTYNQRADEVAPRTLVGSASWPLENDGVVSVTWSLMRK